MDKLLQAVSDNHVFVIVSLSMVALGCVLWAVNKMLSRVEAVEAAVMVLNARVDGKTHPKLQKLSRVGTVMGETCNCELNQCRYGAPPGQCYSPELQKAGLPSWG